MITHSLLSCPFCGGRGNLKKFISNAFVLGSDKSVAWGVHCEDCKCGTSTELQLSGAKTPYDTPDKAAAAWNRRIPL